jgi:hypothetical protein
MTYSAFDVMFFVVSLCLASMLTWLAVDASNRWSRGRGLVRRPALVRYENTQRMSKAHADRGQGFRELMRAVIRITFALMLVIVLGVLLGGYYGMW